MTRYRSEIVTFGSRVLSEEPGLRQCRVLASALPMTKRLPFKSLKTGREIIHLAVMLYVRFSLLLRNVDCLPNERGVAISRRKGGSGGIAMDPCSPPRAVNVAPGNEVLPLVPESQRDLPEDQRRAALPLVGGRPQRRGAGAFCSQSEGQEVRVEIP